METANSEESSDNTDGVSDVILTIVLRITELLKKNIDSLKIPEILKIASKKIKNLFDLKTEQNTDNVEGTGETEEANKIARDGGEEHAKTEN